MKVKLFANFILLNAAIFTLAACGIFGSDEEDKPPLKGDRVSVLQLQRALEKPDVTLNAIGFVAGQPWANEFWPQSGGYATHAMGHLALSENPLKKIWEESIGEGANSGFPITAQPVVMNGLVYTLDTNSKVSAFDIRTGKRVWRNSVRPKGEDETVLGGGLAAIAEVLYVTNGYNELLALNPKSGGIFWRVKLPSPARAAPSVHNGRVFVVTLDNRLIALNGQDGSVLWDYEALVENTSLLGAASPAVNDSTVIAAFSSGELTAFRVDTGAQIWSDDLAPQTRVGGLISLPDIQALPVLDKNSVIGISFGGRMMSLDVDTGSLQWQSDINGSDTPYIAGNFIFTITSANELVAQARDSGTMAWVQNLEKFIPLKENAPRSMWSGPVLAGNRLIVTAPDGSVLEINPQNGEMMRRFGAGGIVAVPPVVASNTLFLLTSNGILKAYQ